MRNLGRVPSLVVLSLALSGGACGDDGGPPEDEGDADGDGDGDGDGTAVDAGPDGALIDLLEADGLTVTRGESTPFYIADCETLDSCYGSNASSPYAHWNLPPGPGETRTPGEFLPPRTPEGMSPTWKLREDEAVVYLGRTSPAAAYFSYVPYVFSRVNPDSGERVTVFASVSDSINVANVQTADGDPFDADIAIILTADRTIEETLRARLVESGVAEAAIQTMVVSTTDVRLGLGDDADELMPLQRFALFEDEAAGSSYLESLPVRILRVTPTEPRVIDPLPSPERTPRGTGTPEEGLSAALDELEAAVRAANPLSVQPVVIIPATSVGQVLDPQRCLTMYDNCFGEVSDTTYSLGPIEVVQDTGTLTLGADPGDFFIAIGVNHQATGAATYSNVVVQNHEKLAGIASLNSPRMAGSAERYLPGHPEAPRLFAIKVARECGDDEYCIEVPTEFPGAGYDDNLIFAFRCYLQPGNTVSIAPGALVTERVLHFLPK